MPKLRRALSTRCVLTVLQSNSFYSLASFPSTSPRFLVVPVAYQHTASHHKPNYYYYCALTIKGLVQTPIKLRNRLFYHIYGALTCLPVFPVLKDPSAWYPTLWWSLFSTSEVPHIQTDNVLSWDEGIKVKIQPIGIHEFTADNGLHVTLQAPIENIQVQVTREFLMSHDREVHARGVQRGAWQRVRKCLHRLIDRWLLMFGGSQAVGVTQAYVTDGIGQGTAATKRGVVGLVLVMGQVLIDQAALAGLRGKRHHGVVAEHYIPAGILGRHSCAGLWHEWVRLCHHDIAVTKRIRGEEILQCLVVVMRNGREGGLLVLLNCLHGWLAEGIQGRWPKHSVVETTWWGAQPWTFGTIRKTGASLHYPSCGWLLGGRECYIVQEIIHEVISQSIIQVHCPSHISQPRQLHSTRFVYRWGQARWTAVQHGRKWSIVILNIIELGACQNWWQAATDRTGVWICTGAKICPGIQLVAAAGGGTPWPLGELGRAVLARLLGCLQGCLFLCCPPSALGVLVAVVHWHGASPGRLAAFSAIWIDHPPRAFPGAFILHPDKSAVEWQVVPDRILQERSKTKRQDRHPTSFTTQISTIKPTSHDNSNMNKITEPSWTSLWISLVLDMGRLECDCSMAASCCKASPKLALAVHSLCPSLYP